MHPISYLPMAFMALGLCSVLVLPTYQMVLLLPIVRIIPSPPLGVVGGAESSARGQWLLLYNNNFCCVCVHTVLLDLVYVVNVGFISHVVPKNLGCLE